MRLLTQGYQPAFSKTPWALQGRKQQVSLDGHGGSERPGTQVEGRGIHHRAANPSTMHKPIVSGILILFPAPISILLYVHKRGWGFLATMSVGSNTARVLLLQRGSIMLSFSETNLVKRFTPIAMISLLVFAYKSKIAQA
jgi:hypothetical protein